MTITNPEHIGKCWCGEKPGRWTVRDWHTADHYLRHGRSPHSRPLANNTRVLRLWDGDIGVRLHSTVVVVYPRPGLGSYDLIHENKGGELHTHGVVAWFTLGGYNTMTTRDRINRFTPARVGNRKGKWDHPYPYLWHAGAVEVTIISSEEAVAVNSAGELVASAWYYPMATSVHELAQVPYTTVAATPGAPGWKQETHHFFDWWKGKDSKDPAGESFHSEYKGVFLNDSPSAQHGYTSPAQVNGDKVRHTIRETVPGMNQRVSCPAQGCVGRDPWTPKRDTLDMMIVHLNDSHKWSREAIADWLESLDLDLEFRKEVT